MLHCVSASVVVVMGGTWAVEVGEVTQLPRLWIDGPRRQFGAAQNHELQSSMILAEEAIRLVEATLVDIK